MIVLKFGGTSVSGKRQIIDICSIVEQQRQENPLIVVSALSSITDLLISLTETSLTKKEHILKIITDCHFALIEELWRNPDQQEIHKQYISSVINRLRIFTKKKIEFTAKEKDSILSQGELMSSYIISNALKLFGITSTPVSASKLIVTDDHFGEARFFERPTKIAIKSTIYPLLSKNIVPVITGFIGATSQGEVTTLGRGGSDYTASIIGSCINAKEIQIWTDVDGILTGDPKIIKNAKTIHELSYEIAEVLALSGAKVIHPKTMNPAKNAKIPIRILNTFNDKYRGTLIYEESSLEHKIKPLVGIAHKHLSQNMVSISLIGKELSSSKLLHGILKYLHQYDDLLKISLTASNDYKLCFVTNPENNMKISNDLHNKFFI